MYRIIGRDVASIIFRGVSTSHLLTKWIGHCLFDGKFENLLMKLPYRIFKGGGGVVVGCHIPW